MFNFSIVNSVGGPASPVSRKVFDEALDSPKIADICRRIVAENDISLKRNLFAFCWHATFKNNKRNSFSAIPSGLAMIDVDHVDEPVKLFESVREAAIEIGLVAAHVTPSTKGLRMVFAMPEGVSIEAMQRWVTDKLQLQGVDGCTKDLARLSFVVPRGYWLYVDYEALFGGKMVACNSVAPSGLNSGERSVTQGSHPGLGLGR